VRPHKTIPALKNNLYIYRRRGGRIVSVLCRNEADLVGDLSAGDLSNAPFASQPPLHPDSSLPFSRETARGTAFGIRVAHRGWAPLALIITTRGNEVFIVGQRSFVDGRFAPRTPFFSFFLINTRIARTI